MWRELSGPPVGCKLLCALGDITRPHAWHQSTLTHHPLETEQRATTEDVLLHLNDSEHVVERFGGNLTRKHAIRTRDDSTSSHAAAWRVRVRVTGVKIDKIRLAQEVTFGSVLLHSRRNIRTGRCNTPKPPLPQVNLLDVKAKEDFQDHGKLRHPVKPVNMKTAVVRALHGARRIQLRDRFVSRAWAITSLSSSIHSSSSRLITTRPCLNPVLKRRGFSTTSTTKTQVKENDKDDDDNDERKWSTPLAKQLAQAIDVSSHDLYLPLYPRNLHAHVSVDRPNPSRQLHAHVLDGRCWGLLHRRPRRRS